MAQKYDVLIVGAGPAGMFTALEILKKDASKRIGLIDMGPKVEERKANEVMSGFGGAGTYSDGKLLYTAKLSHERTFHLIDPEKYQAILDEIDQIFTDLGVDSEYFPKNKNEVQELVDEAERNDIELVVRRAQHVGTDKLRLIIKDIQHDLEKRGVEILSKTRITDLVVKKGKCSGVIDEKGHKYYSEKILLAPGRIGAKWLQQLADKVGIKYQYGMVEVGVRVEFPKSVMKRYADTLYEIVLKVRTKTYDDTMRTFCSCPDGLVAIEEYKDYVCVNGHSTSAHDSANSNFAFVCEVSLTEPVENSIEYAESIARLATVIGGGKPIIQRLTDLRRGRRSTPSRLKKSIVKPSLALRDTTPGDISMALPHRLVTNIIEGLEKLDTVMPGVNSGSTILYAPEVKFRSSFVSTDKNMQTTLKNVYVAGDASGLSGTITGAAATGIMAARGIMKGI